MIEIYEEKKERYRNTKDYKISLQLIKGFIDEVLQGDIEKLKDFDFGELEKSAYKEKYCGNIPDPDMYVITQAIYIVLWGHIWDLNFSNLGSWGKSSKFPYRGDTMNSYNSYFGKFAYRAKFFDADKDEELWKRIHKFHKSYHKVGNFIVIPNRATDSQIGGINGARGGIESYRNGMRDYFDWFLITIYNYQQRKRGTVENIINDFDIAFNDISRNKFEGYLDLNHEYLDVDIAEWQELFYLDDYFKEGKPQPLFKTPAKNRRKTTAAIEDRKGNNYYSNEDYLLLLDDYILKSELVSYTNFDGQSLVIV